MIPRTLEYDHHVPCIGYAISNYSLPEVDMEKFIELIADLISKPAFWGFVGVLAGGAITWLREWMKERQERRRELAYASSLISAELYRFVSSCSDVAGDSGRPDELGHCYPVTGEPTLAIQGIDVEWRSMPAQLVDRILSLPNNLNDVSRRLDDLGEHMTQGDEGDYLFERRLAYAELGVSAEELRSAVRKAAALDEGPPSRSARFLLKQRRRLLAEKANREIMLTKHQPMLPPVKTTLAEE